MKAPKWQYPAALLVELFRMIPSERFFLCILSDQPEIYADSLIERVFFDLIQKTLFHAGEATEISVTFSKGEAEGVLTLFDNGQGIQFEFTIPRANYHQKS